MDAATIELGVSTTLIGMGTVFAILIILSFSTWALNVIVDKLDIGKKKPETTVAPTPQAAPAAPAYAPAPQVEEGISPQVIAAITAAVTMATGVSGLQFKAIRRGGHISAWAASGNQNIMNTRQRFTEGGV